LLRQRRRQLKGWAVSTAGHRTALTRRLRAKIRRELPVWGLDAPVTIEGADNVYCIEAESEQDALIAEGFASAQAAMFVTDLRRRLWSGRLSELLGDRELAEGLRSPDLDIFLRILGFRPSAERKFRGLGEKAKSQLELYAKGVNAWIDAGLWRKQACWERAGSRPRLWAPADSLLLAQVEARMALAADQKLEVSPQAIKAGWTGDFERRITHLWDLVRALPTRPMESPESNLQGSMALLCPRALRWEGVLGCGSPSKTASCGTPVHLSLRLTSGAGPRILPLTLLEGGDNHRYHRTNQRPGRLQARRQDVEIGQAVPLRHWIRRTERGGLISDLLLQAREDPAPAGQAFLWSWEGERIADPSPPTGPSISLSLSVEPPKARLPRTRLVPL